MNTTNTDQIHVKSSEDENTEETLHAIYKNALEDPSLISTLDINKLLDDLECDKTSYLENKTLEMINKEVYDAVSEVVSDIGVREELCKRLIGYRYVSNICDLHTNKHVKTISLKNPNTTTQKLAGTVVNVKFTDKGAKIGVIIQREIFLSYMFHNYLTFQKLSDIEQMILMAYSHI